MKTIGIDLSWSGNQPTGIAVLDSDSIVVVHTVTTNEEILEIIQEHQDARIAIDAPLVVPNTTGRRAAEDECQALFGKHHAGAHPANRTILTRWTGEVRGEVLLMQLENLGFVHDPTFVQKRSVAEVYPHAASITLFGLEKVLPYKARKHRTYETRWEALSTLQTLLQTYAQFTPYTIIGVRGKQLKEIEDCLDAIFCAVIAQQCVQRGAAVLGSIHQGSITVPAQKNL